MMGVVAELEQTKAGADINRYQRGRVRDEHVESSGCTLPRSHAGSSVSVRGRHY